MQPVLEVGKCFAGEHLTVGKRVIANLRVGLNVPFSSCLVPI